MVEESKATITYTHFLKEDLMIFRVAPNDGIMPEYESGQFLTFGIPVVSENYKLIRRAYSIASHPENRKYFEFVVRWVRKPLPGRVTTQLFYTSEGDQVYLGKPTGNALTINQKLPDGSKDERRIVCIAGGTGIAPFVSFARHLNVVGDKREIVVLHGSSYVDELSYKGLFREKITKENTMFYICGWQGTIDGVMDYMAPKGFVTMHDKRKDGSFEVKYESYG
ncbi:MAG: ferredoxin--NADP reductase [Nitrosopumilales archaeon]|nr:ferredoxin--NADP reductase [Nitrosopumilales archaeon]